MSQMSSTSGSVRTLSQTLSESQSFEGVKTVCDQTYSLNSRLVPNRIRCPHLNQLLLQSIPTICFIRGVFDDDVFRDCTKGGTAFPAHITIPFHPQCTRNHFTFFQMNSDQFTKSKIKRWRSTFRKLTNGFIPRSMP